ncbi:MAG TPA: L,D-transpeptidase catalytic domain protein, partial [Methylomirabilota bacterium]|nr:L,D-transpeptidase catalytic domain protein [Methylomirabilota bacterium]
MNKKHTKVTIGHGAITDLRVVALGAKARSGRLIGRGLDFPCVLGRAGTTRFKREGDGASPAGRLRIVRGFYRPDRFAVRPRSAIQLAPLHPADGWSDDPRDPAYNRLVRLPRRHGHERMWRDDGLYDIVLVLDWNRTPRARGRGSA